MQEFQSGFLEIALAMFFTYVLILIFKSDLQEPSDTKEDPNERQRKRAIELIKKSAQRQARERDLRNRLNPRSSQG